MTSVIEFLTFARRQHCQTSTAWFQQDCKICCICSCIYDLSQASSMPVKALTSKSRVGKAHWRIQKLVVKGTILISFPLLSFLYTPLPCREATPLNPAIGVWGSAVSSPYAGPGRDRSPNGFINFKSKIASGCNNLSRAKIAECRWRNATPLSATGKAVHYLTGP